MLGYIAGVVWLRTQLKHHDAQANVFWGLVFVVVGAGLLGGKLGFFLVERRRFLSDPAAMLRSWNTGWVYWSGILLGIPAGLLYQRWHNARFRPRAYLPVADYCVAALSLGHILGRFGCLAEGCCYGRPTNVPWAIAFTDPATSVVDSLKGISLHPTQLYEVFGELAASVLLIGWLLPQIRAGKLRYGTAFFGYFLYYSVMRFIVELFRGDDRGIFLWPILSPSQWASLATGLVVSGLLFQRGVRERDSKSRSLFLDGRP
jgi:phosphatidylglycerol:prolipoprotein diacylglycerol transferase